MVTNIRKRGYSKKDGLYTEEGFVPWSPPEQIFSNATATLPANDTVSSSPCVIDGGATQPFDNGTTDYRYISFSNDGSNGLRVSYSNDLITWTNEVAVTGFTGAASAVYPILCVDHQAALTSRKTAGKTLFYVNLAGSGSARLRQLTINNDNNKTGTADAATTSTIVASSAWNDTLVGLFYAQINNAALENAGSPAQHRIFMIGGFYDGTSEYSLGAIYGKDFANLSVKKINVVQKNAAYSTTGFLGVSVLTRELGAFHSMRDFKGVPVLLRGSVAGVGSRVTLGVCQDGFHSIKELGTMVDDTVSPYKTGNLIGMSFLYRASQAEHKFWFLRGTLVGSNTNQFATTFKGFGGDGAQENPVQVSSEILNVYEGSNGAKYIVRHVTASVTLSGATTTATGFFPDGAMYPMLSGRVSTLITGASGSNIGDGVDPDMFGANVALAAGTQIGPATFTAALPTTLFAPLDIVFTALTSDYTAGAVFLDGVYTEVIPPTS